MMNAARMKLHESAMKAGSRPNCELNHAPMEAPSASIAPQVVPRSDEACLRSCDDTRFATDAWEAGEKKPASVDTRIWATNASQIVLRVGRRNSVAAAACSNEAIIMIVRRSNLSASGPAIGVTRNAGNIWLTKTSDAPSAGVSHVPLPRSVTLPMIATVANQSPPRLTTVAIQSRRKSRFRRSRSSTELG